MLIHSKRKAIFVTLSLLFTGFLIIGAATLPKNVDYPYYGGDPGAQRYSTLTQIDAKNVSQLKEVWRYDLGGRATIENQPIVVNGILYGMGADTIYALDAATGKVKWETKPPNVAGRNPRGETFWTDGKDRRLLVARGAVVTSLDADTGKIDAGFGVEGDVDLNEQLRGPASENRVSDDQPGGDLQGCFRHRRRRRRNYASLSRRYPWLGRAHWQTALDVPHDSLSRRGGLRHLAQRRLPESRRRERLGWPDAGCEARHCLRSDRIAGRRFVRRRTPRQ